MPKKKVYVESSVISYLTARPARILSKLVKQQQTADWWENRQRWELFISTTVVQEIQKGDPDAALKRIDAVEGLPQLPATGEALEMAHQLVEEGAVPKKALDDALHIAIAAMNSMDYLATWNQTHIFNPDTIEKLYSALRKFGYKPAVLVRPDYLLEKKDDA
jgi:predicted nucleic acid-binding protein